MEESEARLVQRQRRGKFPRHGGETCPGEKTSEFFLGRVGRLARYKKDGVFVGAWEAHERVLGRRTRELLGRRTRELAWEAHERELGEGPWSFVERSFVEGV